VARERVEGLTSTALLGRKTWKPLPAVAVLYGEAAFFKGQIVDRFVHELFGKNEPWVRRFRAAEREAGRPTLADVADELRTPSFLSPSRLVVVEAADAFIAANREALEGLIGEDLAGGHLILLADALDSRTRFAKAVAEKGWSVACQKPFDRPPPWKPEADPWDNDLCRWVVVRAREKGFSFDLETAHAFCQRVGNDLATLDEEMEKLRTYLGARSKASLADVEAVAGELREDTIFDLVDAFLAADRPAALAVARRLFEGGYHPPKGAPILDPVGITTMFIGALVGRLRALRRAHALAARGQGPDAWVGLRLTPKPFLPRFQRDLRATPPARIERAFAALLEIDRSVKIGGRAEPLIEAFLLTR
jgi:DNA polymerase III delta subunit